MGISIYKTTHDAIPHPPDSRFLQSELERNCQTGFEGEVYAHYENADELTAEYAEYLNATGQPSDPAMLDWIESLPYDEYGSILINFMY